MSLGKRLLTLGIVLAVSCGSCMGLMFVQLAAAEKKAKRMCTETTIGSTGHDALERAKELDIRVMRQDDKQILTVEGVAFQRWFCEISLADDHVTSTKVSSLD